jgi:hypothetical protein
MEDLVVGRGRRAGGRKEGVRVGDNEKDGGTE